MGFIDSYKHVEKICGEILNDDRRLSAYIDEMIKIPNGAFYVNGWTNDLKQLKHYRWIRNKIVHEPDCSEQNMCNPEDALWLDNFYSRIMNQTDPLSMYAKAVKPRRKDKTVKSYTPQERNTYPQEQPETHNDDRISLLFIWIFVIILIVFFRHIFF